MIMQVTLISLSIQLLTLALLLALSVKLIGESGYLFIAVGNDQFRAQTPYESAGWLSPWHAPLCPVQCGSLDPVVR